MRKSVDECQLKLRLKELSNLAIKEQKLARMDVAPSMLAAKDRVLRIVEVLKSVCFDMRHICSFYICPFISSDNNFLYFNHFF